MPYSSVSEARIKKLNDVSLTLEQVNSIAKQADAIGGDYGWPTAIKHFKKTHFIKDGKWAVKKGASDKEFHEVYVEKENGRYKIVGVSTAAVKDREDETFTVEAMDYDIAQAKELDSYPEFRMFHKSYLAIGKVEEMRRAGIFAIDSGYSYDDPFSLSTCKMLEEDKTGKWRMSRGFYVIETNGICPECSEQLLLRTKHMLIGFKCPGCGTYHSGYKGVLKDVHFRKTRTFDVTVTDVPALPFTGVTAYRDLTEDLVMNVKELRKKLLDAGLEEEIVDERLATVTEKQLESMEDIPFAMVLKEVLTDEEEDEDVDDIPTSKEDGDEQLFVLDPEVLKDFSDLVVKEAVPALEAKLSDLLDGLEVDIGETEMEVKEIPGLVELKEQVEDLSEKVTTLLQSDDERLKEMFAGASRGAKFRIVREKCDTKKKTDEDEEEDEEDEDEVTESKQLEGVIIGADGKEVSNMTEFVIGQE